MSTVTARQPRPYVFIRPIAEIELVLAYPEDLKVYNVLLKQDVLKMNIIFWLKSGITGKISGTPYITTPQTNPHDIKQWLDCNMIYLAKSPFN